MSPRDATGSVLPGDPRLDLDRIGGVAPDRLTLAVTAYLLLPALLFLGIWAQPWAGLPALAMGAAAFALSPGWGARSPLSVGLGVACLLLGLAWALPTGALHLVYATADWQVRDAVLRDLALYEWPLGYAHARDGRDYLLRAPIGYFLPAGLVGRLTGFPEAQMALWLWTGLGLALVLALLAALAAELAPGRRGAFALLAGVFALFHGLDILPNIFLDWSAGAGWLRSWGRGGEWWPRLFQYPGHVTGLLWAPNHALPAWLGALVLLRHWRHPGLARGIALPLAAAAFFSPIGAAGVAVLAVAAVLRAGTLRSALLAAPNWLAVVFALPLGLYLTAGAEAVPHGVLWAMHPPARAAEKWALLLLFEVLPWALLAAMLVRGWLLLAAAVLLAVLPAYVFGAGNETASRGSQAALAVLAVGAGAALLAPAATRARRWARGSLIACVVLAALGSAMEASLLLTHRPWPASMVCSVPEAARQSVFRDITDWSHYFARWPDPRLASWLREPWFLSLPPPGEGPRCWPSGGV